MKKYTLWRWDIQVRNIQLPDRHFSSFLDWSTQIDIRRRLRVRFESSGDRFLQQVGYSIVSPASWRVRLEVFGSEGELIERIEIQFEMKRERGLLRWQAGSEANGLAIVNRVVSGLSIRGPLKISPRGRFPDRRSLSKGILGRVGVRARRHPKRCAAIDCQSDSWVRRLFDCWRCLAETQRVKLATRCITTKWANGEKRFEGK